MKSNKMVLLFVCVALVLSACGRANAEKTLRTDEKAVKVYEAKSQVFVDKTDLIGVMHPEEVYTYGSKIPGKILRVFVEEGEAIEKGTPLFQVDDKDLNKAMDNSTLALDQARKQAEKADLALDFQEDNFYRLKSLYENGAISKVDYDAAFLTFDHARLDAENAKKQLERAKVALDKDTMNIEETIVYANKSGVVSKVLVEEEGYIGVGNPVLLVQSKAMKVIFGVSEGNMEKVYLGGEIIVMSNEEEFKSRVSTVGVLPNESTRLYEVEAIISSEGQGLLSVGSVVTGYIIGEELSGIALPVSVVLKDRSTFVYIVSEGIAQQKEISILKDLKEQLLIDGLSEGDLVVVEGMSGLDQGDCVNVLDKAVY